MDAAPRGEPPPLPEGRPKVFRTTVHGTVFAGRERHLEGVKAGDDLVLIPDPPGQDPPEVWVHLASGDPVGHLPPEVNDWLVPWMNRGGRARASVLRIHGRDVPSWRRLIVQVRCGG